MPNTYTESSLTTLAALKSYLVPAPVGAVKSLTVTNGGTGYGVPTVTISAPNGPQAGGIQATATANVAGGIITGFTMTNVGSNYVSATVTITGGGGSNATATATIGEDAALQRMIAAASGLIVQAANLTTVFDTGSDRVEVRNGNGRNWFIPQVTPIISVTSITVKSQGWALNAGVTPTTITASDGSSAGYLFDANKIYLVGYTFPQGVQNVTLTYRAGAAQVSSVQAILEQACLVTIGSWWNRRAHINSVSESPQGIGSNTFSQADIPKEAHMIINQIRAVVPVL